MTQPFTGPTPTQCAFGEKCPDLPLWYPCIWVFAKGYKYAPPMKMLLSMPVCDTCAKTRVKLEDVIIDEGWEKICKTLEALNKAEPDRSRNMLNWWSIKDAHQGKFPS